MKAINLLILPLSLINIALATPFYVGLGVNLAQQTVNSKQTFPLSSTTPSQAETDLALNAVGLGVTLGYASHFTEHWGLDTSLNVIANYGNNTRKIDNWFSGNDVNIKVSTPFIASFTAALNYQWRPDISLLIGPTVTETSFKSTSSTTAGNIGPTGDFSQLLFGAGLTAGVDYVVSPAFHVQLTDTYTMSSNVKWTATEPLSEEKLTQQYQLSNNQLQLNCLWYL